MTELAGQLSIVDRGDTLVITGYPDEKESEWHVNSATHFGEGPDRRAAIILQAADKSSQFLTIALERKSGEWSIDDFAAFEGKTPPTGGGAGESVDPSAVEVIRIEG